MSAPPRTLQSRFPRAALAAISLTLGACASLPEPGPEPGPRPREDYISVRLTAADDAARALGLAGARLVDYTSGRGRFVAIIGGEHFKGQAARAEIGRQGIAIASGGRGNRLECHYVLAEPAKGAGTCEHSAGGKFEMEFGR